MIKNSFTSFKSSSCCLSVILIRMGNLLDVGKAGSLHEYLMLLHEKYGAIAGFWWGKMYVVSLASPEYWKEVQPIFDRPRKWKMKGYQVYMIFFREIASHYQWFFKWECFISVKFEILACNDNSFGSGIFVEVYIRKKAKTKYGMVSLWLWIFEISLIIFIPNNHRNHAISILLFEGQTTTINRNQSR